MSTSNQNCLRVVLQLGLLLAVWTSAQEESSAEQVVLEDLTLDKRGIGHLIDATTGLDKSGGKGLLEPAGELAKQRLLKSKSRLDKLGLKASLLQLPKKQLLLQVGQDEDACRQMVDNTIAAIQEAVLAEQATINSMQSGDSSTCGNLGSDSITNTQAALVAANAAIQAAQDALTEAQNVVVNIQVNLQQCDENGQCNIDLSNNPEYIEAQAGIAAAQEQINVAQGQALQAQAANAEAYVQSAWEQNECICGQTGGVGDAVTAANNALAQANQEAWTHAHQLKCVLDQIEDCTGSDNMPDMPLVVEPEGSGEGPQCITAYTEDQKCTEGMGEYPKFDEDHPEQAGCKYWKVSDSLDLPMYVLRGTDVCGLKCVDVCMHLGKQVQLNWKNWNDQQDITTFTDAATGQPTTKCEQLNNYFGSIGGNLIAPLWESGYHKWNEDTCIGLMVTRNGGENGNHPNVKSMYYTKLEDGTWKPPSAGFFSCSVPKGPNSWQYQQYGTGYMCMIYQSTREQVTSMGGQVLSYASEARQCISHGDDGDNTGSNYVYSCPCKDPGENIP